jgi:dipeptidyl-peptidase-4
MSVALLAMFMVLGLPAQSGKLPLERLFTAPDLSGPSLRGVKISPDGRLVAYLQARGDDKDRFDLWAYDVSATRHRLLVDSRALAGADRALSAEEEARRERQRTSAYSGIVEYSFAPDSRHLLIPLVTVPSTTTRRRGRQASHQHRAHEPTRAFTALELRQFHPRPEPVIDLANGTERR